MINKLRLQYYKLLIKYYSLFEKRKTIKISYRWYYTPYDIKTNIKRDKIVKCTTLYNELFNLIYPEKIKIHCLESCGVSEFEKAVQESVLFIQNNKI